MIITTAVNNISTSRCLFNEPIEIDELIILANQSNYQIKGTLVIKAAKIIIVIFENNKQVGRLKHSNKRRRKNCYVLIKKNGSNLKNISDFSENSKVSYGRFKRNGLHERYWYISTTR